MASVSNYYFNNLGRIGEDSTDITQRTVSNTKFANYMLSNFDWAGFSPLWIWTTLQQDVLLFCARVDYPITKYQGLITYTTFLSNFAFLQKYFLTVLQSNYF